MYGGGDSVIVEDVFLDLTYRGEPTSMDVESHLLDIVTSSTEHGDLVPDLAQVTRDDFNDGLTRDLIERSSIFTLGEKIVGTSYTGVDGRKEISDEFLEEVT